MSDDDNIRVLDFKDEFYFTMDGSIIERFFRKYEMQTNRSTSPTDDEKEVYEDTVHLSEEGGKHFMEVLHDCLRAAKFDNKKRRVVGSQLPTKQRWFNFREDRFGKFGKQKRFRLATHLKF